MLLNICPGLNVDEYMSLNAFEYILVWKKRFSIPLGVKNK